MGAELGPTTGFVVSAIIIVLSVWLLFRAAQIGIDAPTILLALVPGGAGNLVDRASHAADGPLTGSVVERISVDGIGVFNVADIFVIGRMVTFLILRCARALQAGKKR